MIGEKEIGKGKKGERTAWIPPTYSSKLIKMRRNHIDRIFIFDGIYGITGETCSQVRKSGKNFQEMFTPKSIKIK